MSQITLSAEAAPSNWPAPLEPHAFHGIAGQIVQLLAPHTEADPAALLFQLLAGLGSQIGRNPHFRTDGSLQHCNINVVIVGQSSKARKGTSWGRVSEIVTKTDPSWEPPATGLNSGEGLVAALQDEADVSPSVADLVGNSTHAAPATKPPKNKDKRLLLLESEFARLLLVSKRDSNTVTAIIRDSFDTGNLRVLNKNSPIRARNAHVAIVGHITQDELVDVIADNDCVNGFSNRFLWVVARRDKLLPLGGSEAIEGIDVLVGQLAGAVARAKQIHMVKRDAAADAMWIEVYPQLSVSKHGQYGSSVARSETFVVRLSLILAVLDGSDVVTTTHLRAALALWSYADRSAAYIFGQSTGSKLADVILEYLRSKHPTKASKTDICDYFKRNIPITDINAALAKLEFFGLSFKEMVRPASGIGRSSEMWGAK